MTKQKPKNNNSKCTECGFRIRGKNHNEGGHHTSGRDGRFKPAKY